MSELKIKTVEDSKTEVSHLLFSKHMNSAGRLFGGQLLMWIDEVAGIVARRHCEGNLTTACIDNLQFKEPCYENDVIVIIGYVTHVGRSSMEIRIDTYVERPDGSRHPVNRAFFVMVILKKKVWLHLMQTINLSKFHVLKYRLSMNRPNGMLLKKELN